MSTQVAVAHVIDGEAPESDDEYNAADQKDTTPQAAILAGKTPESDEDIDVLIRELGTSSSGIHQKHDAISVLDNYKDSILHRKLYDNNIALRASIVGLLREAADNAFNKLSLVDQDLLNSQVRMQGCAASATTGRQTLSRATACLEDAIGLSANTLPSMKQRANK